MAEIALVAFICRYLFRHSLAKIHIPDGDGHRAVEVAYDFKKEVGLHKNIMRRSPAYVAWKNAYVVTIDHNPLPLQEGVKTTLWWLYPDGKVEEIISYTRDKSWPLASPTSTIPALTGVYFMGGTRKSSSLINEAGIYRHLEGNRYERLVPGRIGSWQLSPDGCKLAFGNDDRWYWKDGPPQHKLQVIDLCEGERK